MTRPERPTESLFELLGLGGALMVLVCFAVVGAEPQHHALAGVWEFNPELTAALARNEAATPSGSQGEGMGHRHEAGRHGGAGSGDPDAGGIAHDADYRHADPDSATSWLAALQTLAISEQAGVISIADRSGRARSFKTDGTRTRDEASGSGPAELRSSWGKDGSLVVEVKPDKGSRRTETYLVSNDARHLYLTVTRGGSFLGSDAKTVRAYDAVPPAPPPAAVPPPSG